MENINRRNYFRIDDRLEVSYQVLGNHDYLKRQQEHRLLRLQHQQQWVLEQKINSGIRNVELRYPDLGEIFNLLNQKIEQLGHSEGDLHHSKSDEMELRPVNISASGIAFFQDEPLAPNTPLELQLTLYRDKPPVQLFGQVVHCVEQQTAEIEHYKISVEFEYVVEEDREELVHYIMQQQNIALRQNSGIDDDFE